MTPWILRAEMRSNRNPSTPPLPGYCSIFLVALLASSLHASPRMTTYTYKRVGDLEIKADVVTPEGFKGPRPVLVWLHGGALMGGRRQSIEKQPLRTAMLADGGVVVSIDYRLAPETKLPQIIADVEDAFRWIREQGPSLFNADPGRIIVAGSSAGGYLTLTMGYRLKPRPLALISFWGYGDLIGDWYSKPSSFARHREVMLSKDEAYAQAAGAPVANATDRRLRGEWGFYQYCRREGIWPQEATGWNPRSEPEKFYPYMPLKNITPDYPPTLLVHGLKDTDVPVENALLMDAELGRNGVEHWLITDPDADHSSNWSEIAAAKIQRAAIEFIRLHLR